MSRHWPNWMRGSLEPDEIIGEHKMLRWHILPRFDRLAIYLHKHQGSDPRTPHDHPADNISIRLRGTLIEYTPDDALDLRVNCRASRRPAIHNPERTRSVWYAVTGECLETARRVPRFQFRRAEDTHRLELPIGGTAWTIWIRFRIRRPWGYFEATGWRCRRTKTDPTAAVST